MTSGVLYRSTAGQVKHIKRTIEHGREIRVAEHLVSTLSLSLYNSLNHMAELKRVMGIATQSAFIQDTLLLLFAA